jgi:hypothetical protein
MFLETLELHWQKQESQGTIVTTNKIELGEADMSQARFHP